MTSPCPCGSGRRYAVCCGAIHSGGQEAKTAETLMRSRYSAYVLKLEAYLLASWHPDTRPLTLALQDDRTQWLGLQLHGVKAGGPGDDTGEVSFTAQYRVGRERHRLDEESRFVRQGGRWVYLDARGGRSRVASASAPPR